MSEAQADLVSSRDTAMRVAEILLKKGAKNDAIEVLTVWASAKNDADGHKLLAEALRHGSDNPLAKAAFAQMEGIGDGAVLAPFRTKWTVETLARIETEAKKPSVGWAAEVGYNNNVKYRNLVFHIQTEDSGVKRPHIITHVFADGGRIIKSVKRSYASLIGTEALSNQVRELMKGQHKEMYIALREGRLDDIIDGRAPGSMETLETPPNTEARKKPPQPSHPGADSVPPPANKPQTVAPPATASPSTPAAAAVVAPAAPAAPAATVPRPAAAKQVLARLHVIRAMGDGPLLYDLRDDSTVVGRGGNIDIVGDPYVSPNHAKIRVKNGRLEVEDLNSKNGTYLRIRRPVELDFGDLFIAGDEVFRLDPTPAPNDGPDASPTYFYSSPKWPTTFRLQQLWDNDVLGGCHVARSSSVQIGRTASDVNFPNDFWMSDAHCVVEDQDGFHMLTDLGSRGGTFTKVKQATRLVTGDELLLGRTRLRVEVLVKPVALLALALTRGRRHEVSRRLRGTGLASSRCGAHTASPDPAPCRRVPRRASATPHAAALPAQVGSPCDRARSYAAFLSSAPSRRAASWGAARSSVIFPSTGWLQAERAPQAFRAGRAKRAARAERPVRLA